MVQSPERDNPSLHPIRGDDAEGVMTKLDAARDRVAKVAGRNRVSLSYCSDFKIFLSGPAQDVSEPPFRVSNRYSRGDPEV